MFHNNNEPHSPCGYIIYTKLGCTVYSTVRGRFRSKNIKHPVANVLDEIMNVEEKFYLYR